VRYKRVLVKISGGALAGSNTSGFDPDSLNHIANEVLELHGTGVELGVVVGGGNIFRGRMGDQWEIEPAEADNIGMMGTVANSLMLRGVLKARGVAEVRVMTAIPINNVAEPFIRLRAIGHLEKKRIVIFAAGTGIPFVTTDYAAVHRALELDVQAMLSAKQGVDGVYTADPQVDSSARRYRMLSYGTVLKKNLQALDPQAVMLAKKHGLPIHVFGFDKPGLMGLICAGEDVGTLIRYDGDEMA
jgi:uridylate kinase